SWLYHLRARQNYLWQHEGSFAGGDRTCRSVCNQIRCNGVNFDLNLATVGGSVGDFFGPNGNICQGRRGKRECRFCDLRSHDRYSSDPRLHSSGDRPVSAAQRNLLTQLFVSVAVGTGHRRIWICYFRALKIGEAAKVAPIDKLSVVLVALFGVVFLGERLT